MKICTENAVYVQRKDINYIINSKVPLSPILYLNTLKNKSFNITQENKNEFIEFLGKTELMYFQDFDWLLDYNSVNEMSFFELLKLLHDTRLEEKMLIKRYFELSEELRNASKSLKKNIGLLEYKYKSLKEFVSSKYFYKNDEIEKENVKLLKKSR